LSVIEATYLAASCVWPYEQLRQPLHQEAACLQTSLPHTFWFLVHDIRVGRISDF